MAAIAFLLPCSPQARRGNATTAHRIADFLARGGHEIQVCGPEDSVPSQQDVVIALNAAQTGPRSIEVEAQRVILLFTGTDLNGRPSSKTTEAVQHADALVALGTAAAARARDVFQNCGEKLLVIPQAGVALSSGSRGPVEGLPQRVDQEEVVFLPTGLRSIKNPQLAVEALIPLAKRRPGLRLWIAGERLEEDVTEQVLRLAEEHEFVEYLGALESATMAGALQRSKVVLSTSRSEGGPPNALLEAALASRPILASAIPAHREFLPRSAIFKSEAELRQRIKAILDDPSPFALEASRFREDIRHRFAPAREGADWLGLVSRLLA